MIDGKRVIHPLKDTSMTGTGCISLISSTRDLSGIYTTNWIERLNKEYKRVVKMRGAMPNPESVIVLMGTVAQNMGLSKTC